ncbi:polysaccharide pyruvyl transferase family protein [Sphingomonas sp. ac-8]|uniref:polysaccharide pyruvyl transferase family protein n=1 Tax=Sphingomonas sp. ac-8 TaxID=3242977 RepID=UPI003A7FEF81
MPPPRLLLFDPSIASRNLGDQIILEAVEKVVAELFPTAHVVRVPTQLPLGLAGKRLLRHGDRAIVGGTNLLTSHMLRYRQWKIDPVDAALLRDCTLLGVGWWQYQGAPDAYTRRLLCATLAPARLHAVRDEYTAANLRRAGIAQVVNTGCPTLWALDQALLDRASAAPSDAVVCTVTDYRPDPARDGRMLDLLRRHYARRYLWLQGIGDWAYLQRLDTSGFEIVDPNLAAFDAVLRTRCEFLGTRLHAGIRALQAGCYARIIPVDNRATEMARDFGLPLLADLTESAFDDAFVHRRGMALRVPVEAIARWKRQFAEGPAA